MQRELKLLPREGNTENGGKLYAINLNVTREPTIIPAFLLSQFVRKVFHYFSLANLLPWLGIYMNDI